MRKSGLVALSIPIDTKIMHKDVVYKFKKITEKGYMFVDDEGNRKFKRLMYPLKRDLPQLRFITTSSIAEFLTTNMKSYLLVIENQSNLKS